MVRLAAQQMGNLEDKAGTIQNHLLLMSHLSDRLEALRELLTGKDPRGGGKGCPSWHNGCVINQLYHELRERP